MSDELENGFSFCEWGSTADIPRSFLEDDVGGLHELKLVSRLYKSPEQVERHLVSESLSDIDRALLLVRTGSIVQQTSVFRDFLRLYRVHSPAETFPVIHAALDLAESDRCGQQYLDACVTFLNDLVPVLPEQTPLGERIQALCLRFIKSTLPDVCAAWSKLLLRVIQHLLPDSAITQTVVPSALEKIEYTHPPASRIWNAKVLVAAIVRLSKTLPQQEPLVVTLLHLCQDTDHEVRMCLCQQLSSIARVTSGETCAKLVAPELLELLNDEEPHVRAAAVGVLADIATSVAAVSDCCGRLLAAAMRLCRDSNPLVRQALAEELGPVFWALKDHLSSSDTQTLQHLLHSLCTSHNASLTCQGLHSLPALLRMNAVGADSTWITAIMTQLSMSPELSVRIKVAQVFHAVAEALEGRSAEILLPSFHLLLDEQSAVFVPFAQHLDATLSHLCSGNPNRDTPELLLPIVRKAGALVRSHAWRDQLALLQQTHHFEEYFDLEMLQDTWIPILLQLMAIGNVAVVQETVAGLLARFLRKLCTTERRRILSYALIQDFAKSPLYRMRCLFIEVCKHVCRTGSSRLLRELLLESYLALVMDPVIDVRMRAALILSDVIALCKLSGDDAAFKAVATSVSQLQRCPTNLEIRQSIAQCDEQLSVALPSDPDALAADAVREREEYPTTSDLVAHSSPCLERRVDATQKRSVDKDRKRLPATNVVRARGKEKPLGPVHPPSSAKKAPTAGTEAVAFKPSLTSGSNTHSRRPRLLSASALLGKTASLPDSQLSSSGTSAAASVSHSTVLLQQLQRMDVKDKAESLAPLSGASNVVPSIPTRLQTRTGSGSNPLLSHSASSPDTPRRKSLAGNLINALGAPPSMRASGTQPTDLSESRRRLPAVAAPTVTHKTPLKLPAVNSSRNVT